MNLGHQSHLTSHTAKRGGNQVSVRSYNERLILDLIREQGALSKSEAAKLTGLSNNAAAVILRALEEEKLAQANEKRAKFGKTVAGNWVNLGKVTSLKSMGFHEDLVVMALRSTDNDMNEAIDVIQNRPAMLEMMMEAALRDNLDHDEDDNGEPRPGTSWSGALIPRSDTLTRSSCSPNRRAALGPWISASATPTA